MTTTQKLSTVGAVLLGLSLSFAAGRLSRPAQVETKAEWQNRQVTWFEGTGITREAQGPVRVVTKVRERPAEAGCPAVRETEQVEERGEVTRETRVAVAGEQQQEQQGRQEKREVAGPRLLLAVQAGAPLSDLGKALSKPDLEVTAAVRTLGPVNVVASLARVQLPDGKADTRVLAGLGVSF